MDPALPFRMVGRRRDGDATVFTVDFPEDCPFFENHFPGRPVLPAIGQLVLLATLLRRVIGPSADLTGVDGLRLSRQVAPGDRVEIRLNPPGRGGRVVFAIRRDGATVSRGALGVGTAAGG